MQTLVSNLRGEAFARLEEVEEKVETLSRKTVSCGGLVVPLGVAAYRAVVCAFAVAMLWCTSLAVARSVAAAFVPSPPFDAVRHECRQAYDEIHRQREAHLLCTAKQAKACELALAASLAAEKRRSHRSALSNREIAAAAEVRQKRCSMRRFQALESVQKLQAAGLVLVWRNGSASCPPQDLARAQALVGDIGLARTHAMDVATRYTQNALLLQHLSLSGLDHVQAYDASYLSGKRDALRSLPGRLDEATDARTASVRSALVRLNSSMALCGAGLRGTGPSEAAVWAGGADATPCDLPLQSQIEQMHSQYDALLTGMRQQQRELLNFHDDMEAMVAAVKGPLNTMSKLVQQINPDLQLPAIQVPDVHMPEVHLPPLPSIDDMRRELFRWSHERQTAAQSYLTEAVGSTEELRGELAAASSGVSGLLDDYRPPSFNTSAARSQMDGEAERFLDEQAEALSAFATVSEHTAGANSSLEWNGTNVQEAHLDATIRENGLRFEPFSSASISVEMLTLALANVALLATMFDFLWRGWRSARLVLLYWSRASVGLPTLDLREDATSTTVTKTCQELGRDPARCVGACLASPLSGVAIIALALFLLFKAATALYIPAYLHYVDGCIAPPRNGTFLTRNLFSLSYNYAASEGNQLLLHSLDRSNLARAANCSVEVRRTTEEQRVMQRDVDAAELAYRTALSEVHLMRTCLQVEEVDRLAEGAGVQPYVPLRAVLADDACEGDDPRLRGSRDATLENGVFNCTAVAPCESGCDGPSRAITATFCQRCGCHAEWFLHGIVLHTLLALLVFASLNAFRMVLVDAVCRIFWKQLFAGSFEFIANCDDYGMTNVSRSRLLEALRAAVRGHVATGWLLLGAAFALNVPWFVVLTYVSSHLDVGHAVEPGALSRM